MDAALKRCARENRWGFSAPVPAPDYYRAVYKGGFFDELRFYVCTSGSPRIRKAGDLAEVLSVASGRSDVYLHPCDFYSWPCLKSVRTLYSIKIDLDHVSEADERSLIASDFFGLRPTFAIRSGSGLHLDFILDEPLACYRWRIPLLQELMKRVQEHFRGRGSWRVDHTSLMQGFRVVGSRTKRGGVCRAYPVGDEWTISELAAAVGVPDPTVRPASQEQNRKEREQASRPRATATTATVLPFPVISTGGRGFYSHVRGRIAPEVREGHRELALFALAVVGKKCGVPRDVVECDIRRLFDVFAARAGEEPMQETEVEKSLVGYSDRYIRTRSTKLETWLGFTFPRATKRNGRDRSDHGKYRRAIRTKAEAENRRARITAYLMEHPEASNSELARALGITRRTAAKYRGAGAAPVPVPTQDAGGVCSSIAYNTAAGGGQMGVMELGENGVSGGVCSGVDPDRVDEKIKNFVCVCSGSASGSLEASCGEDEPPRTVGADPVLSRLRACRARVGSCSSMPSVAASVPLSPSTLGHRLPTGIRERLEWLRLRSASSRAGP